MTKKNTENNHMLSFVFSQKTLSKALTDWLKIKTKESPEDRETFQIVEAAIPWFMKHLNQTGSVYMFTEELLLTEIENWKRVQISSFPHQVKRIEMTCELITDFFFSETTLTYKMVIAPLSE